MEFFRAYAAAVTVSTRSALPNPSIEPTATGMAPRSSQVYSPLRGAMPAAAAHVKR